MTRLNTGESHLAVHPRCGTNLVTAAMLVGLTTFLAMLPGDQRSRRERLPLVVLLATLALMLAQPLGLIVQRYITTDASPAAELTARIHPGQAGKTPVHRIHLDHGA
jgi:uncharacterized protein YqhQ